MNYIQKLKQENEMLKQSIECADLKITEKLTYLTSSKFQGHENNFVNATEAYQMLMDIRMQLNSQL